LLCFIPHRTEATYGVQDKPCGGAPWRSLTAELERVGKPSSRLQPTCPYNWYWETRKREEKQRGFAKIQPYSGVDGDLNKKKGKKINLPSSLLGGERPGSQLAGKKEKTVPARGPHQKTVGELE